MASAPSSNPTACSGRNNWLSGSAPPTTVRMKLIYPFQKRSLENALRRCSVNWSLKNGVPYRLQSEWRCDIRGSGEQRLLVRDQWIPESRLLYITVSSGSRALLLIPALPGSRGWQKETPRLFSSEKEAFYHLFLPDETCTRSSGGCDLPLVYYNWFLKDCRGKIQVL
jgi:hypothetical protein